MTYWTVARLCYWKQQFHVCSSPCTGRRTRTVQPSLCLCPPPVSRSGASWSRWDHRRCQSESHFLSKRNWWTKTKARVRRVSVLSVLITNCQWLVRKHELNWHPSWNSSFVWMLITFYLLCDQVFSSLTCSLTCCIMQTFEGRCQIN